MIFRWVNWCCSDQFAHQIQYAVIVIIGWCYYLLLLFMVFASKPAYLSHLRAYTLIFPFGLPAPNLLEQTSSHTRPNVSVWRQWLKVNRSTSILRGPLIVYVFLLLSFICNKPFVLFPFQSHFCFSFLCQNAQFRWYLQKTLSLPFNTFYTVYYYISNQCLKYHNCSATMS